MTWSEVRSPDHPADARLGGTAEVGVGVRRASRGADARTRAGVLLQTDGGWVLLDTGFNTALVRDPALYRRFFPTRGIPPRAAGPGEPIEERLAEIGVDIDEIHTVAVSHLHHDHAGGLKLFAGKVPVHAQRRELEYGLSNHPEPERNAIVRVDFDDPSIDWQSGRR